MKRFFLFILLINFLSLTAHAETLKMKDGTMVSGSIISQTEYTLNLRTSYGVVTLNQRQIEQILPDKHRLILNGGTQLIGIILDMDEFNLKLQTDDGAVVNVDMPQIVSIEAYDYNQGQNAQQEYVEQKIAQQEAAKQQAAAAVAPASSVTAGGLTFDSDIDQVFGAQTATVVNGQVQTPTATVPVATPQELSDEEKFLRGSKNSTQEKQPSAKETEKTTKTNSPQKGSISSSVRPLEKNTSYYFTLQLGAMPLDLKLDNSEIAPSQSSLDVGGTSIAVSGKFLFRIKESNLWAGPTLGLANISNNSFPDLSPAAAAAGIIDPTVTTSGRILTIGGAANYYLNPAQRFAFYLTASAVYEMLTLNYRGAVSSHSVSSNGLSAQAGIGVETWVDDLMLGIEVREAFAKRGRTLSESSSANTIFQAQLSWKF